MRELPGSLLPAEEVEVEVVAAGGAVEEEGKDGEERGEWDEEQGSIATRHRLRVKQAVRSGGHGGGAFATRA